MRKASGLVIGALLMFAVSTSAEERHQSYFTYEDGGTVVVQSDGRQVNVRQNYPLFPGDEVRTSRRGRAEIRLADGNIVAIDGATALRLESILDSYEGKADQTVARLSRGQVIVQRLVENSTALRLDTQNASYVSDVEGIYGVATDGGGKDVVSVYEGSIEVRTPAGASRVRSGEQATVDERGVYGGDQFAGESIGDFERWFLARADAYNGASSDRLDSTLAYAEKDLDRYGSWVWVSDSSAWAWRPYVGAGWRPYYDGRWVYSPGGSLVWVSDEPWGWAPYHYGRWAYSGGLGWYWFPGYGYSHAWVYWAWGPSYVGWAPAGWYDCWGPYYGWAYNPYWYAGYGYGYGCGHGHCGYNYGYGFYGHANLRSTDLAPWTFVPPGGIVSDRVDQAALTTQAIRERLDRDGDRAAIARGVRLTRDEIRDPSSAARAISRREIGGGTGKEGSGGTTDLTPFFRRDPELSSDIRTRLTRPLSNDGVTPAESRGDVTSRVGRGGGGTSTPESVDDGRLGRSGRTSSPETPTTGTGRTIGRERTTPAPSAPAEPGGTTSRIGRQRTPPRNDTPTPDPEGGTSRVGRQPAPPRNDAAPAPSEGNSRTVRSGRPSARLEGGSSEWRSVGDSPSINSHRRSALPSTPRLTENWRAISPRVDSDTPSTSRTRSGDGKNRWSVSRTVIEGIGGPRVTPKRDGGSTRPDSTRSGDQSGISRGGKSTPSVNRSKESGSPQRSSPSTGSPSHPSGRSSPSGRSAPSGRSSGGSGRVGRH